MDSGLMDEEFLQFESKVNEVVKILENMCASGQSEEAEVQKKTTINYDKEIDPENFIVTVRDDRTVLNKDADSSDKEAAPAQLDKFTFMQQMEEDVNERAKVRQERERIAQNFRSLGNEAFRKATYEKAINFYTKGIEHVKDSPILYNNRALSYVKLKNYKRAIIDCDYVLNKLDEKNMRSWLYRAAAYKRLNDELNYETSIKFAKKNNSKEIDYIEAFDAKIKTGAF